MTGRLWGTEADCTQHSVESDTTFFVTMYFHQQKLGSTLKQEMLGNS